MKQLLPLSPQLKLLTTAPFVIAREDLLYSTLDFLVSEGYSPMSADSQSKAELSAGAALWARGRRSHLLLIGRTSSGMTRMKRRLLRLPVETH